MTRDELEFSISQYHDGTLSLLERNTVEEVLARDADARAILSEYQRLDSMLASDRSLALPEMDWDAVHTRMSGALADAEAPVKTLRLPTWSKWAGAVAAVAAVIAIAVPTLRTNPPTTTGERIVQVSVGPAKSVTNAPVTSLAQVSIGPSAEVAQAGFSSYDDSISYRDARVLIAASEDSGQDAGASGTPSPYQ